MTDAIETVAGDAGSDGAGPRGPLVADVASLHVRFDTAGGPVEAVRGVSFRLAAGRSLALVGESGSGKSVTARSLLGLVGGRSEVRAERLEVGGNDVRRHGEREWRAIRGVDVGLVSQDALVSLDPLRPVGREIAESLTAHRRASREEVGARVLELLTRVGVPEPEQRARQRPYELSGGLRQRALIASALAGGPRLLIADEPTTALDATVQARVLKLLRELRDAGTAVLLISHDLAAVAQVADDIAVMREGVVVEQAAARRILTAPEHPYTRALLDAVPGRRPPRTRTAKPSPATAGEPAGPEDAKAGTAAGPGREAQDAEAAKTGEVAEVAEVRDAQDAEAAKPGGPGPVLEASGLRLRYRRPGGGWREAVHEVSLALTPGRTLGVVGESGSGKSTLARLVLGLEQPDAGTVRLDGTPWSPGPERSRRQRRRLVQLVDQDPLSALDPRYPVRRLLGEALAAAGVARADRQAGCAELLTMVGLAPEHLRRRPWELSGGQRQRVAIARALATRPRVLVCDEPVSALDVSLQAQVLDLLASLRDRLGLAVLFISHDLAVIREIADEVMVMRDGRVLESGPVEQVFADPADPWTRELIAAAPAL
ncbi:dipeptide ABC transporter ATP-binding protein [Streptomyces sp. NRRL F-5123]|uniref:dipeptide ABC transporter ATP-binding protein n=1 Tax=Streptomyces sp. NRRL F-5123 TaxID=1463856 RepID=UPI0006933111|nr:ABC transporter ATP-binding protein [Streptomyces sp. NRRL F-5123]